MTDFAALYRRIPSAQCKGLCWGACGPILVQADELTAIEEADGTGVKREDGLCPYLNSEQRCSVYEARPLICRLYGVVEGLPCPHDCISLRTLSNEEVEQLLFEAARISPEIAGINLRGGEEDD